MSEREPVARWLYQWRHHREWDGETDLRGIELCREQADELLTLLQPGEPVDPYEGIKQHVFGDGYHCVDCGTNVNDAVDQYCNPKWLPGYPKADLAPPEPSRERMLLQRVVAYFEDTSHREAWGPMVEEIKALLGGTDGATRERRHR